MNRQLQFRAMGIEWGCITSGCWSESERRGLETFQSKGKLSWILCFSPLFFHFPFSRLLNIGSIHWTNLYTPPTSLKGVPYSKEGRKEGNLWQTLLGPCLHRGPSAPIIAILATLTTSNCRSPHWGLSWLRGLLSLQIGWGRQCLGVDVPGLTLSQWRRRLHVSMSWLSCH